MADGLTVLKKYQTIIDIFKNSPDRTLTAYDERLSESLNLSTKQIGRLLDDLVILYDNIVVLDKKIDRKTAYKMIKPTDLFTEKLKQSDEIGWFFQMAGEMDPEIFKAMENYTNENKNIFLFKNSPFEDISTIEQRDTFKNLKSAVENREYRKIVFYDKVIKNAKCLKLIFMDGNWYIAFVDDEEKLRFGRISFIKKVEYSDKISFQKNSVTKYLDFIKNNLQNSMTIFDKDSKKALIKATPQIAKYFKKDMKKFYPSQKFIEELEDGSILFSLNYTQELEILPFIQRWLPDLVILEPTSLKDTYLKKLEKTIKNHSN